MTAMLRQQRVTWTHEVFGGCMAILDLPHMIATGLIVFAVIWLIENLKALDGVSKGRKTLLKMVAIFVVILLLNLVWPYGSTG